MVLRISKRWTLFFLIKILFAFFGIFVFNRVSSLGDSFSYAYSASYEDVCLFAWKSSTWWMSSLGYFLRRIGFSSILAQSLFLSVLVFFVTKRIVLKACKSNEDVVFALFFLSLPTYAMWTSVISKEAVITIGLFFILSYLVNLDARQYEKNWLEFCAGILIIYIFKKHYLLPILNIIFFVALRKYKYLLFLIIAFQILLLFVYADSMGRLVLDLPRHFSPMARSTRESFWAESADFLLKAPYGMFLAFWGTTFKEVLALPLKTPYFIESLILFASFFIVLRPRFRLLYLKRGVMVLFVFFSFLFVHYPAGVMNDGSALRYRSNFVAFLFLFLLYFRGPVFKDSKRDITRRE